MKDELFKINGEPDKTKLAAWNRFKRMVAETTDENDLYDTTSRELIAFKI